MVKESIVEVIGMRQSRSQPSITGRRYLRHNPFHLPAIPNLMRETETEREIFVNMDYMSMLEFGHFFNYFYF